MSSKIRIRIGDLTLENRFILAPMSGITNMPFRLIVKGFGASLVTTEMISAKGLCYRQKRTYEYLIHMPEESPISMQIFGSEPEIMADAAQIAIKEGADIIDINMGCPAKKVLKTGAGGYLLKDLKRAEQIIKAVRRVCDVPLTIKIRSGWSSGEPVALNIAKMAQDCGVDAITIHPRSVAQGFSGRADWSMIAKIKEKSNLTIIGSGDIFSARDAMDMIKRTGCDAVMIARGAMGNPWIFRDVMALENGEDISPISLFERKKVMQEHYCLIKNFIGEKRALRYIRGVFVRYAKGLPYSSHFREQVISIKGEDELMVLLNNYFFMLEEMSEGKGC